MSDADIYELYIEDISHEGLGVAKLKMDAHASPIVIFIQGALPTQKVKAKITKRKANFWEGKTLEILDLGQALNSRCQMSGCGGCPIQSFPYAEQLKIKTKLLHTALNRIGQFEKSLLDACVAQITPSPKIDHYRNKMEFAFGLDQNGEIILGQRSFHSSQVVATKNCLLMPEGWAEILNSVQDLANQSQLKPFCPDLSQDHSARDRGFWRSFILRHGFTVASQEFSFFAICLTSQANKEEVHLVRKMGQTLLNLYPKLAVFIHEERKANDVLAQGEKRLTTLTQPGLEPYLELPLGEKRFVLDPSNFFQVNLDAAQFIWQILVKFLDDIKTDTWSLLDLYSGVGAPSLLLASRFKSVLGLEINPKSVRCAQKNVTRFDLKNCTFKALPIERLLTNIDYADIVLADPPRQGLGGKNCQAILKIAPKDILYISCNPTTLARDLNYLSAKYSVQKIYPIDLFPHTIHLETVSILTMKT